MKFIDQCCAGILCFWAIVSSWAVPRNYTGRIWLLGTALALLFAALLNVLRLRNGYSVRGLKLSCLTANVAMLTFFLSLLASIGRARALGNPHIIIVAALLAAETGFSLGKNA